MMMTLNSCAPSSPRSLEALAPQGHGSCRAASLALQEARDNLSRISSPRHFDLRRASEDGQPWVPFTQPAAPPSPTRPLLRRPTSSGMMSQVFNERTRLLGPEPSIHPRLIQQRLGLAWALDAWRCHHPEAKTQGHERIAAYVMRLAEHVGTLMADLPADRAEIIARLYKEAARSHVCQPDRIASTLRKKAYEHPEEICWTQTAVFAAELASIAFSDTESVHSLEKQLDNPCCDPPVAPLFVEPSCGTSMALLLQTTELLSGSHAPGGGASL